MCCNVDNMVELTISYEIIKEGNVQTSFGFTCMRTLEDISHNKSSSV